MLTSLKNSFIQATLGSIIWVMLLSNISNFNQQVPFQFFWKIILIGGLCGIVFGIVYPYLWNYSTYKASTNILISTISNVFCMFVGVKMYSNELFKIINPFWLGIIVITLCGHIVGFYVYSTYRNKRLKKELNSLI